MGLGVLRRFGWFEIVPCRAAVPLVLIGVTVAALASPAFAQPPGFTVEVLLRTAPSGDDTKDVVVARGELAAGASTGRHTHPGDEYATVLEGELELRFDDGSSRRVRAGEAYHNGRDVVHETRNVSDGPVRVVSTFVIDRGKPLSAPATPPRPSPGS